MVQRNVAGGHVQDWGRGNATALSMQKGGALKVLNTANSTDRVRDFVSRNPHSPVCCRRVAPQAEDNYRFADFNAEESIRAFENLQHVVAPENLWLEDGINEANQTGEELKYRDAGVQRNAPRIRAAGFRPVGFNFSVANPPRIDGATVNGELITPETSDLRFIQDGTRALIENDGAIGYHNYTIPSQFQSSWYDLRHRRMRRELPPGINWWLGEGLFDHGIVDGRLAGWRDDYFHLNAEQCAQYVRWETQELSKDFDVVAWTPFGAGAYEDWWSFEYANEQVIINVFTELYDVTEPTPINVGQGLRRMIPYLGQPLENEVYHFPGTPMEVSLAVFENGTAMWYRYSNEVVGQRSDGAIFTDRGNNGDGSTVWEVWAP